MFETLKNAKYQRIRILKPKNVKSQNIETENAKANETERKD